MQSDLWATGISIGLAMFAAGCWLGGRMRNGAWSSTADGEPRIEYRGDLYHVVRDGDLGKAQRVAEYIRGDLPGAP